MNIFVDQFYFPIDVPLEGVKKGGIGECKHQGYHDEYWRKSHGTVSKNTVGKAEKGKGQGNHQGGEQRELSGCSIFEHP